MQIVPPVASAFVAPQSPSTAFPIEHSAYTSPAAAAALLSNVDLLNGIEQGMVRNFSDAGRVALYANDLRSANEIFAAAQDVLRNDTSSENDTFLPLINNADGSVTLAGDRLSSKNFVDIWPIERGEILAAVRRARALSQHVANQLDPRGGITS